MDEHRPVVFIGSSTEAHEIAKRLEVELRGVAETRLWNRVFEPGEFTLERLQIEAAHVDFAILVLAPDDVAVSRRHQAKVPRDNVVFEAGLFMSMLGRERTFLVEDKTAHLKLPSDIMGITTLRYDGEKAMAPRYRTGALRPIAQLLRERIAHLGGKGSGELPSSILRVLQELTRADSRLPLSVISGRYAGSIREHLESLYTHGHYTRHAQIGVRMRRIFEDSGQYVEGIGANSRVVDSLRKLGHTEEAHWAELKGVAYLEVLSGRHASARARIQGLLAETEDADEPVLRAYAHRYLGISFLRDPVSSDLARARTSFEAAATEISKVEDLRPSEFTRFRAKLDRNFANLVLSQSGNHVEAIRKLEASRAAFELLSDYEHQGISALAKARAMIAESESGRKRLDAREFSLLIGQAERAAVLAGWPEGVGSVQEVRAEHALFEASRLRNLRTKRLHLERALDAARVAQASFRSTDARHRVKSIDGLIDRIEGQRRSGPRSNTSSTETV